MEFFNDLSKRFSNVARSVSGKGRDAAPSGRPAGELRAMQAALEQAYAELGRLCYDARDGRIAADQAEALFDRIDLIRERIEVLTAQPPARRCPACGTVMPRAARFCFACGKRLPEDAPALESDGPADVEYCPECGAQRLADEPFCGVCARAFDPAEAPAPSPARTVADIPFNIEEPEAFGD